MFAPDMGPFFVPTRAVSVENTHNFGGGAVLPYPDLLAVRRFADDHGIGVHLDGARLWNATVATGVKPAEYGVCADTVSVCLSKGLGAPAGSVLASSAERVAQARVWRKRYGGGMRQVGVLAAAGLHALDHHVERLVDDHRRARRLAEACADAALGSVDPDGVATNIVVLDVDDAPRIAAAALEEAVAVSVLGPRTVRLVTHLDVDDDGVDLAARVLPRLLGRA
jgi:threonine aldolase